LEPNRSDIRRYRILGLIGVGGFGKVYRARLEGAEGFYKDVAIKLLHDENPPDEVLQRSRDEARLLGLLRDRAFISVDGAELTLRTYGS
jgi:serine/threonine protein kinase